MLGLHDQDDLPGDGGVDSGVIGWPDYHLWVFIVADTVYGVHDPDDAGWRHKVHRASSTTLGRIIGSGVTALDYVYDMGDNWEHRALIERVEPDDPGTIYPDFCGGERRCPPEDCGASQAITSSSTPSPGPTKR